MLLDASHTFRSCRRTHCISKYVCLACVLRQQNSYGHFHCSGHGATVDPRSYLDVRDDAPDHQDQALHSIPFLTETGVHNVLEQYETEAEEKGLACHPVTGYPYVYLVVEAFHDRNANANSQARAYSRTLFTNLGQTLFNGLVSPRAEILFSRNRKAALQMRRKLYGSYVLHLYTTTIYHLNFACIEALHKCMRQRDGVF